MIRFRAGYWWNALFVYYGGVLPRLLPPTIAYIAYTVILFQICSATGFSLAADGVKLIAGCTTFMLVFRLNQCYGRLVKAQDLVVDAITSCRSIVFSICAYLSHGARSADWGPADREAALLLKVHMVRLSVAYAVSLKFHMRVADMLNNSSSVSKDAVWHALADLVRVKSMLTDAEANRVDDICGLYEDKDETRMCGFIVRDRSVHVDFNRYRSEDEVRKRARMFQSFEPDHGGTSVPLLLLQLLRGVLMHPLDKKWGIPERYLNYNEQNLANAIRSFEGMHHMVIVPLPLPYLQLCKMLVLFFILFYPFSIDLAHGIWGNVIVPCILAMALLGFEIVADYMENPMGDDPADISLYELIHEFEVEVQAMFDLTERDHLKVMDSWRSLANHFDLGGGSSHLIGDKSYLEPVQRPFTDFFEWIQLPEATVRYILTQSSEASSVHKYASAGVAASKGKDAGCGSDSDDEILPVHPGKLDVFTIKRCLSLRGSGPHQQQNRSQIRSLDEMGDQVGRCKSIRAKLTGSRRPQLDGL